MPRASLVTLPPEVLTMIFRYLRRPSDHSHVSQACTTTREHAEPPLYSDLSLQIPSRWTSIPYLESLTTESPRALKYTTQLSITTRPCTDEDWDIDYFEDSEAHDSYFTKPGAIRPPTPGQSDTLNLLIRSLIRKISPNRLTSFEWAHDCTLGGKTLDLLFNRQCRSLQHLQMRRASPHFYVRYPFPPWLATFNQSSMVDTEESCWQLGTISNTKATLRHLTLGREIDMVNRYASTGELDDDGGLMLQDLEEELHSVSSSNSTAFPLELWTLHLIGLRLIPPSSPIPISVLPFTKLEMLQVLCLESCIGAEAVLSNLATRSHLSLKRFQLRFEGESQGLHDSLASFLRSFSGLVHLSVLLDKTTSLPSLDCFLTTHGPSLRSLTWEGRTTPRTTAATCTSLSNHTSLLRYPFAHPRCDKLRELGIPISWNLTYGASLTPMSYFTSLKSLRTMNIRTLPGDIENLCKVIPERYLHEYLVRSFLRDVFLDLFDKAPPKLEIIIIGAFTVADCRELRTTVGQARLDELLSPRIYFVEWQRGIKRDLTPILTSISAQEAKYYSDNLHVLEPCWLN